MSTAYHEVQRHLTKYGYQITVNGKVVFSRDYGGARSQLTVEQCAAIAVADIKAAISAGTLDLTLPADAVVATLRNLLR